MPKLLEQQWVSRSDDYRQIPHSYLPPQCFLNMEKIVQIKGFSIFYHFFERSEYYGSL